MTALWPRLIGEAAERYAASSVLPIACARQCAGLSAAATSTRRRSGIFSASSTSRTRRSFRSMRTTPVQWVLGNNVADRRRDADSVALLLPPGSPLSRAKRGLPTARAAAWRAASTMPKRCSALYELVGATHSYWRGTAGTRCRWLEWSGVEISRLEERLY